MLKSIFILSATVLLSPLGMHASEVPRGTDIFPHAIEKLEVNSASPQEDYLEVQMVAVEGQPFNQAIEAKTLQQTDWPWHTQFQADVPTAVDHGDVVLLEFWMRTPTTQAESGEGKTQFTFEQKGGEFVKSVAYDASAGSKWMHFQVPFRVRGVKGKGFAPGEAQICFRLGYRPQTIQLADIRLTNYGSETEVESLPRTSRSYAGREADVLWRAQAQSRIEELRMAPLVIRVVDAEGNPVKGASVDVQMTRHAFFFGSAINLQYFMRQTVNGERYREFVLKHYNQVAPENDLKWNRWERDAGVRQNVIDALYILREHDIHVRGHCLIWPGFRVMPPDIRNIIANRVALDERIEHHFEEILDLTDGLVDEWDVVNEPYAERAILDRYGDALIGDWFRMAHDISPEPTLYLNDYAGFINGGDNTAHKDYLEQLIADLLAQGVPVQGLGIQGHFGSFVCPPEAILKELDRFGKFGLPIQITEFDIDSMDEKLKADYTRDFLTACFSHPGVVGVNTWGFWEGDHWKPSAALVRKDWTLTPWGAVWFDLIEREWWTHETGTTDRDGRFSLSGFLGDYEITVEGAGKKVSIPDSLAKDQPELVIEL